MNEPGIEIEEPPLGARLKYYLLGFPPERRYAPWVERDVYSDRWALRAGLTILNPGLLVGVFNMWRTGSSAFLVGFGIGGCILLALYLFVAPFREWQRARTMVRFESRWAKKLESSRP